MKKVDYNNMPDAIEHLIDKRHNLNVSITKGKEYEYLKYINNLIEEKISGNRSGLDLSILEFLNLDYDFIEKVTSWKYFENRDIHPYLKKIGADIESMKTKTKDYSIFYSQSDISNLINFSFLINILQSNNKINNLTYFIIIYRLSQLGSKYISLPICDRQKVNPDITYSIDSFNNFIDEEPYIVHNSS